MLFLYRKVFTMPRVPTKEQMISDCKSHNLCHCFPCQHLISLGKQGPPYSGWHCKAFPDGDGIPASITMGKDLHTEKHPLQTGDYVYKEKDWDAIYDELLRNAAARGEFPEQ